MVKTLYECRVSFLHIAEALQGLQQEAAEVHSFATMPGRAFYFRIDADIPAAGSVESLHIENTVESCKSVRSEALDMGLTIAVENHSGDLQATQLKTLIEGQEIRTLLGEGSGA